MIQLLLITLLNTGVSNTPKLIYVGDPMCSWCYGIAPELVALKKDFDEELDFELVLGGLRPYNTQTMLDLKDFLTHHWEDVHKRSGQEFNYTILDDTSLLYDTEPPSRANMIVRELMPHKSFEFFHASQSAFYLENKNMGLAESYYDILTEIGVDAKTFTDAFNSAEAKNRIKDDFKRAEELGVRSFPTILLELNGEYHAISQGYATKENMEKKIRKILSN